MKVLLTGATGYIGSAVAEARKSIRSEGRPLHIDELLRSMGKPVTRASRASLAGSIAAYVRRDEIFTRPAPNTFGLVELERANQEDEPASEEAPSDALPDDFGNDRPTDRWASAGLN